MRNVPLVVMLLCQFCMLLCQLCDVSQAQSDGSDHLSLTNTESAALLSTAATLPTVSVAPAFQNAFDGLPQIPSDSPWDIESSQYTQAATTTNSGASPTIPATSVLAQSVGYAWDEPPTDETPPNAVEVNEAWQLPSTIAGSPIAKPVRPLRQIRLAGRVANFLSRRTGCDLGIGHERVMYAPHVVETAIGTSNTGILIRADRGLSTPDRLEAIWAAPARGPSAETRVDILDTVFRMDVGNNKLMAMTDYTMRSVNPERNDNTTGFGDMVLGAKATLFDGPSTKVSSVFRTYLKTGPADRGLGTGHVSLEPGFLLRHQLNQHTYFHGEAKYWLPIAGTPAVAGDVLKLGAALSTVWKESDTMALLPTLEFSSYTFLSGSATQASGIRRHVNGEFAGELYPGLRCVHGPGNELGLLEYGFASGIVFADDGWFDSRLVFDIRFVR